MKMIKKVLPLLLCLMMVITVFTVTTSAAGGSTNVSMTVSVTEVNVGDTVTVTVSCNGMKVSSFGSYIRFDGDLLEIKSIVSDDPDYPTDFGLYSPGSKGTEAWIKATAVSDVDTAKANNQVGFAYAGTEDATYNASVLFTATFTAKSAGTVTFTLVEDSDGADGYSGTATTQTVTIKEVAPACDHVGKTYTYTKNEGVDTHKVVCECNATVEDGEPCTGGTAATCTTKAVCSTCKAEYGALNPENHSSSALGWSANYNGTHEAFCNDCVNTTGGYIEDCTYDAENEYKCVCGATEHVHAHDHYKTEDGKHQSICSCDEAIGEAEDHNYEINEWFEMECQDCGWICNHEGADFKYVDYWFHNVTCESCGLNNEKVFHDTWSEEDCGCGAIPVSVRFINAQPVDFGSEDDSGPETNWTDFYTLPDKDLHLNIEPLGEWPYVGYEIIDDSLEDPWASMESVEKTKELVISKEWYKAGDLEVEVFGHTYDTVDLNGGTVIDEEAASGLGEYDPETNTFKSIAVSGDSWTLSRYKDAIARDGYQLTGFLWDDEFYELDTDIEATPEGATLILVWECQHETTDSYTNDGATHTKTTACPCGKTTSTESGVSHSYDETTHKCVCDAVETFKLCAWVWYENAEHNIMMDYISVQVPFGANVLDYIPEKAKLEVDDNIEVDVISVDGTIAEKSTWFDGFWTITGWAIGAPHEIQNSSPVDTIIMPADVMEITQTNVFTGWKYDWYDDENEKLLDAPEGVMYCIEDVYLTGWQKIDDAWYYLDENTYHRAEGLTRVPYPTVAINDNTYAANQEDIEYAGETFIDKDEAWFVFDKDGKFQSETTGLVHDGDVTRYAENGMIAWHPGLVKAENADGITTIYYFVGDLDNGGNKPADGDIYITRFNDSYDEKDIVKGAVYNFSNGELSGRNGIVDGKYYEDSKLTWGKGLVKIEEKYYYVRSNGQVATGEYWITKVNDTGVIAKDYIFDANGVMQNPEFTKADANGIVDGYYYVDGEIAYGAGLIELDDGSIIYVRSNGKLATGKYWPTTLNGVRPAGEYTFGEDGKLVIE